MNIITPSAKRNLKLQEIKDETQRTNKFQILRLNSVLPSKPMFFPSPLCFFIVQDLSEWHRHWGRSETRANQDSQVIHSFSHPFTYSPNKQVSSINYAFHFPRGESIHSMVSTTNMLKTLTSILPVEKAGFFPKKSLVSFLSFPLNSQLPVGKSSRMPHVSTCQNGTHHFSFISYLFYVFLIGQCQHLSCLLSIPYIQFFNKAY